MAMTKAWTFEAKAIKIGLEDYVTASKPPLLA